MKKIIASLLCLLLCASLACCATEQGENSAASSESSETIENPLSAEKTLEVTKRYWNDYVTNRSKPVTELAREVDLKTVAYDSMPKSRSLKNQEEINSLLELCKTLDVAKLSYSAEEVSRFSPLSSAGTLGFSEKEKLSAPAIIFNLSTDLESGVCLGFSPSTEGYTTLVLWVGDAVYTATTPCSAEFASEVNAFFD